MMRVLASALFALVVAACASPTPAAPDAPAPIHLSGTKWRRVDDMNANPHGATLEFGDHRASGFTQCNNWFAAVTQNGEELRFGDVGMTRRACTAEVSQATERSFLEVIAATRYGHYDQDALVLLDENQRVIAEFRTE
jgi:heat shock protein HslJ